MAKSKSKFDPNATATSDSGIFGLPYSEDEARLVLLPVPWEVTTSYGDGASRGPEAIMHASKQVDLFDLEAGDIYRHGIHMTKLPAQITALNKLMKPKARRIHAAIEADKKPDSKMIKSINAASDKVNTWVYTQSRALIGQGKIVGVVGGDHSSPFGLIRAVAEANHREYGILHIDAHADLRPAYQGFTHSHASIMHNVMTSPFAPSLLAQVGIRDFSSGEHDFIRNTFGKISTHFDTFVQKQLLRGASWSGVTDAIIAELPQKVYVSFDIDGLTPDLCPNTGTPVPGGLSFAQARHLIASLVESGRQIIGFDLCEVAAPKGVNAEWDGNVGARILWVLSCFALLSNGFTPPAHADAN